MRVRELIKELEKLDGSLEVIKLEHSNDPCGRGYFYPIGRLRVFEAENIPTRYKERLFSYWYGEDQKRDKGSKIEEVVSISRGEYLVDASCHRHTTRCHVQNGCAFKTCTCKSTTNQEARERKP